MLRTTSLTAGLLAALLGIEPCLAEAVGVVRLLRKDGGQHFFTTSCPEAENARAQHNYVVEGFGFNIYDSPVDGSVPFYRFFGFRDHVYTASEDERKKLEAGGYVAEGVLGHLFTDPRPDHVPLYRAFERRGGRHIYTVSKDEYDTIPALYGYEQEGIAGYVPSSGRQCQIRFDDTPTDFNLQRRTFCVKDGVLPDWIEVRRLYDSSCPREGGGPFASNAWSAVFLPPLPSGFELKVCSLARVPDGWADLGLFRSGLCSRDFAPDSHDMRTIKKQ